MRVLRDAFAIFRMEATLFKRFPKLKVTAIGVIIIPALYALIYLASVRDPGARTGELKAALVNLDQGLNYRGQNVNVGQTVVAAIKAKRTFGFVDYAQEEAAKLAVRQGHLSFALIIPKDFSANAVPGQEAAGGRLVMYVSEGNNYNGANIARRFASELGHQVNINLNESRWSLVLTTATGSRDKLAELRKGAAALKDGAFKLNTGLVQAESGSKILATGADGLGDAVVQLTDGVKQLGAGLRTMDQQRPAAQDLAALKSGSAQLVAGHSELAKGLDGLQIGARELADGSNKMRDETKGIPLVGTRISDGATQLGDGAAMLGAGLQAARDGQSKLADGTQKLGAGVTKLADGVTALGNGIHTAAIKIPADSKLDELANASHAVGNGAEALHNGLAQLKAGSKELALGLQLLDSSLPGEVHAPDGSARGLADSVEPVIEIVAPVVINGAGFAPNFLATSLWLGAVMSAFLFHLRRLPEAAAHASRPARLLGKLGILGGLVVVQALVIMLMSLFLLDLHVAQMGQYALTLILSALTFLVLIVAITRAFGDAGKAAVLLLMVLQLSSAGGVFPVELSGGVYQAVSPWLPFTWVIKALRACMFGAFDGDWLSAWLVIGLIGSIAWLAACFVGRWQIVSEAEHRPAMEFEGI
ncbi:MAG: YhgE/Pip domain-containing protein [Rhodoferax sp.]